MKILHLEDSIADHLLTQHTLRQANCAWTLERVETMADFIEHVQRGDTDLILADYQLPGFTAIDAWTQFPPHIARPPFLLVSGAIGEAAAVSAIQLGFADYLNKDELHRLPHVIQRAREFAAHLRSKQLADNALAESQRHLAQLNAHLQQVIELERLAIAREIHDDIGGALTAAKLDLAWVLRRSVSEDIRQHLDSAQSGIQSAMDAGRRLMLNLRPSILDEGLAPAIRWLADDFAKRHGVLATVRAHDLTANIPPPVQLVAFRVTQEALTNVAKYAQCTHVVIEVSSYDDVLTVEVADNGKGMKKDDTEKPNSFGLRGLRERAFSVGGWLDVSSPYGAGTAITLSVPLSASYGVST